MEDHPALGPIWKQVLQRCDLPASVTLRASAEEAEEEILRLERLGRNFNLIISDVHLAGAALGTDLWMRHHERLPFTLTSSLTIYELRSLLPAEEVSTPIFLRKPVKLDQCREIVRAFLLDPDGYFAARQSRATP